MANVQLQTNIPFSEKVEISPKGFTLGGNVVMETKKISIYHKFFNARLYGHYLLPRKTI
jgi:hypothetical protein